MSKFAKAVPGQGWATNNAVFQLGKGKTLAIPMDVHASARLKLRDSFHRKGVTSGIVLIQGGDDQTQYDSDTELVFRQDSWFNYLFGVKEAGAFGAICLSSGSTTLFVPRLPDEYRIWCGEIRPPSDFKASYAVDDVLYVEDLKQWIDNSLNKENTAASGAQLHLMSGVNSDSGKSASPADYDGINMLHDKGLVKTSILYNLLAECRVTKSSTEIEVMRYCAYVASNAHVQVMKCAKECSFEYELEAKFQYEIYRNGGCRKCAYTCICACGPNAAVLHYGHAAAPNDRQLLPTDMALLDMGAEYHGYVSDITCSFPFSGTFSEDQRSIYQGVLEAQRVVLQHMFAGTRWTDCHRLAEKAIIKNLQKIGVLKAEFSVEEMAEGCVGAVFMPHGLGHLIGCDTHDVGGYLPDSPERMPVPGLNKLRTARVLEVGMVLTNEPGCYFIDALLQKALSSPDQSKYFDTEVLSRFKGFGGVRLEDVVLVTDNGPESLSTCPRLVEEIEAVMAGGAWPPAEDKAPELKRRWTKLAPNGLGMVNDDKVAVVA